KSSSAGSTGSTCPTWTRRSRGRRVARARAAGPSRCGRSGRRSSDRDRVPRDPASAAFPTDGVARTAAPVTSDAGVREAAEAVARRSYGKLVALLAARTRDVEGAEDALADAFTAALVEWPASGVPSKPEAWLLTVARRKQIDAIRRRHSRDDAREHLRLMAEEV